MLHTIRSYACRIIHVFCWIIVCAPADAQEREIRLSSDGLVDTVRISRLVQEGEKIRKADPETAMMYFDSALVLSRAAGYHYGIADALVNTGRALLDLKRYTDSRNVLVQAIPYIHDADVQRPGLKVRWYNTLGGVYAMMGYNDSAVYNLFLGMKEYSGRNITDHLLLGGIYANIAAAMFSSRQLEPFTYYTGKALQIARHINDTNLLTVVYSNLASAWKVMQHPDSSIWYTSKALKLYLGQNRLREAQTALCDIGGVWLQEGNLQMAATLLDSAARLYPAGVETNTILQQRWGRLHYLAGNHRQALTHYQKALALNNQEGGRPLNLNVYRNLADIYAATGQYREAYNTRTAYAELWEKMFNEELVRSTNELQVKYRLLEKNQELMQQQLQLTEQQAQLKQKNIWIGAIGFSSMVLILFILFAYRTRQKMQQEKIQQSERSRIARDLHDGMGALLSAIKMNYTLLGKQRELSQTETFHDGMQLINEMRDELRATAYNLMPENIVRQDLGDAVHTLCNRMQKGHDNIQIDVQTYGDLTILDNELYFSVYRMTEELINNSLKHAAATEILVQLMLYEDRLHITVEDNGKGFDPETLPGDNGMGLHNLSERARQVKGTLRIISQPGMGACIELEVPYRKRKKPEKSVK